MSQFINYRINILTHKSLITTFLSLFLSFSLFAEEALNERYALIIIDMQDDFVTRKGYHELEGNQNIINEILKKQAIYIKKAKELNIPIIFIEYQGHGETNKQLTDLVRGHENVALFQKNSDSMFSDVNISKDEIIHHLTKNRVQNLVITGANGRACVHQSLYDALELKKFNIIAVNDAIADFNYKEFIYPYSAIRDFKEFCNNCQFTEIEKLESFKKVEKLKNLINLDAIDLATKNNIIRQLNYLNSPIDVVALEALDNLERMGVKIKKPSSRLEQALINILKNSHYGLTVSHWNTGFYNDHIVQNSIISLITDDEQKAINRLNDFAERGLIVDADVQISIIKNRNLFLQGERDPLKTILKNNLLIDKTAQLKLLELPDNFSKLELLNMLGTEVLHPEIKGLYFDQYIKLYKEALKHSGVYSFPFGMFKGIDRNDKKMIQKELMKIFPILKKLTSHIKEKSKLELKKGLLDALRIINNKQSQGLTDSLIIKLCRLMKLK